MRILVVGVAGVGKTTACREFVDKHPEFTLITASELIARARGQTRDELLAAGAQEILNNQGVLKRALEQELGKVNVGHVLIDGQCVIDNGRELVVLPVGAIAALQPAGLILLEARADVIVARRQRDPHRRPIRGATELSEQLTLNRATAEKYAAELGLPLVVADATTTVDLEPIISALRT